MEKLVIRMEDLTPEKGVFELAALPGKKIVLGIFSLRVRKWAVGRFGSQAEIQKIIEGRDIVSLAQICYFMLEDKTLFPTEDAFLEAIGSPADQLALYEAFTSAVGLAEPLRKKIEDHLAKEGVDPNALSPNPNPIGAISTTP
jgi:hypothetical protein